MKASCPVTCGQCTASPTPTAPTPAPPPTSPAAWTVTGAGCTKSSDGCATSSNYPLAYTSSQSCTITGFPAIGTVVFATESRYDKLVVNGQRYSGTAGPAVGLAPTADITWSADYSVQKKGWKLCPAAASPTAAPTAFPTAFPTQAPTAFPTASPMASPTAFPTSSPMAFPTALPTAFPTAFPTEIPPVTPAPFVTPPTPTPQAVDDKLQTLNDTINRSTCWCMEA